VLTAHDQRLSKAPSGSSVLVDCPLLGRHDQHSLGRVGSRARDGEGDEEARHRGFEGPALN
jgi:hypothetical protein